MNSGIPPPPEDALPKEQLSDAERFQISREKPWGIETTRGMIDYHNELVGYGQVIEPHPEDDKIELAKRTIFYTFINDLMTRNPQQPIRLLDLGCGNGQFLRELKEFFGDKIETHGVTARAYNRNGEPIKGEAEERVYLEEERKNGIDMEVRNMSDLGHFPEGNFDLVVSAEGINYAGDPLKVVEQASRILKDGGLMLAGPVAISIEGIPMMLAGNIILNSKFGFEGLTLTNKVQDTPLKTDVICFTKNGKFSNSQLHFSHSAKSKNGAIYKRF